MIIENVIIGRRNPEGMTEKSISFGVHFKVSIILSTIIQFLRDLKGFELVVFELELSVHQNTAKTNYPFGG